MPKKLQDSTTFINFAPMKRKIRTYGGYFESFMEKLSEKNRKKCYMAFCYLRRKADYQRSSSN